MNVLSTNAQRVVRNAIPVAITAIYPSKQGVLDLGYTRAHVSFHL